jgi:outer membrane protein OmpA-like peptidoglycan-associated protein
MGDPRRQRHILGPPGDHDEDTHWLSVGDLMAGLMIVFMFIAILYMASLQSERNEARAIAVLANETRLALYEALKAEFEDDLERWNAELDRKTLTVRFREPKVLFDRSSDVLKQRFRTILADFFPRYIAVLRRPAFREYIEEIRIEGHTSSEWNEHVTEREAYFLNMALSQERTRSVLRFVSSLEGLPAPQWVRANVAAVGLSSSRPIRKPSGREDKAASRRVEFRVTTRFEERILQVVAESNG